jgi:hypothetical protein
VAVHWVTTDGTAIAGGDYVAGGGDLIIPPMALSSALVVTVLGDSCGEADEDLTVELSAPSGVTLAGTSATGTIRNDDETIAPAVAVTAPNGGESLPVSIPVEIHWTATDDGGIRDVDILLSRDGGATWPEILASALPNDGTFTWTPAPPATEAALVQVRAHDLACNTGSDVSDAAFTIVDNSTAVGGGPVTAFALGPVQPNPSRGDVRLQYQLPREAHVRLSVLDVQGREVALLVNGAMGAGHHAGTWSGPSGSGQRHGLYFVRFAAGDRVFTRRFAIIR